MKQQIKKVLGTSYEDCRTHERECMSQMKEIDGGEKRRERKEHKRKAR